VITFVNLILQPGKFEQYAHNERVGKNCPELAGICSLNQQLFNQENIKGSRALGIGKLNSFVAPLHHQFSLNRQ
jgi:hypothetical protein